MEEDERRSECCKAEVNIVSFLSRAGVGSMTDTLHPLEMAKERQIKSRVIGVDLKTIRQGIAEAER